jgi:predicted NAD-dependent protein-ADP-ribosyltransferase YbiA (DUF1768 family)
MEVGSRNGYPAGALSNFTAHSFTLDGIECASMEGFLQGLKFKSSEMQVEVCKLTGLRAKKRGYGKNWQRTQTLWWIGKPVHRTSEGYQSLITRAYDAMLEQCESFRKALQAAGPNAVFTHSIGRNKENETVLTEREFCGQLRRCRDKLFN